MCVAAVGDRRRRRGVGGMWAGWRGKRRAQMVMMLQVGDGSRVELIDGRRHGVIGLEEAGGGRVGRRL